MSNKSKPSKNRSSHEKRISQSAPKSSAEKEAKLAEQRAVKDKEAKKKATSAMGKKVAAIIFSALLILAFAVPSVSVLLSGSSSSVDSGYKQSVTEDQNNIDADTTGTVGYSALGDTYFDWADAVASGKKSSYSASDLYGLAIDAYQTYMQSNDSIETRIKLGRAQIGSGLYSDAVATLQAAVAAYPQSTEAWARLGDAYAATGDTTDATTAYNTAIGLDSSDSTGFKSYAQQQLAAL